MKLEDVIHFYLGCDFIHKDSRYFLSGLNIVQKRVENAGGLQTFPIDEIKPILRRLDDMTEEEFKEYAKADVYANYDGYWYACYSKLDPEFEGEIIEYINDCDPENVVMCAIKSKHISYGWIEYEERYHGFGVKEEAEWIRFLLSKGFDLFGLINSGQALDKKNLK